MDIAYASNGSWGGGFAALIPLLVMGLSFGFLFGSIAKRKGRSQWLWFIAGFVPFWNLVAGFWLASLPDKSIFEEFKALIDELQNFEFIPKGGQATSTSAEPRNWKCNCGFTNDINVPNCPECGLKRDYLMKQANRV